MGTIPTFMGSFTPETPQHMALWKDGPLHASSHRSLECITDSASQSMQPWALILAYNVLS